MRNTKYDKKHTDIVKCYNALVNLINKECKLSRTRNLAVTRLQEGMLWTNQSLIEDMQSEEANGEQVEVQAQPSGDIQ